MELLVVSHTHWDREWYHPPGRFRQRLVLVVDELLDRLASDPHSPPFLLDGQAIVLEDYLEVRPDRATEVRAALQAGRLEAGPWYVLADGLLPSGEALIRNLTEGREALRALLGSNRQVAPPVLYCPDAFGHPAALPTIARGFGLNTVIIWRGHGGSSDPRQDVVRWSERNCEVDDYSAGRDAAAAANADVEAPSRSVADVRQRPTDDVLLYHLPPSGYEFGSNLPLSPQAARDRWLELRSVLEPRATLNTVLLLNGADHHALQRGSREAIRLLAEAACPDIVRNVGLTEFAAELERAANGRELPVVHGERRDSYGYTWTLQGTFAARATQKRMNAIAERLLVSEAEPWAALAIAKGSYANVSALRAMLRSAWRTLLQCHPHDTLCGCSTDAVAAAMDERLASATVQAEGVRHESLAALLGADAESARGARHGWVSTLSIRNPVARPRSGVAEVEILETIADEPVGPGSAAGVRRAQRAARASVNQDAPEPRGMFVDFLGNRRGRVRRERIESLRHYPDNDLVRARRAVVWVEDPVPGCGIVSVRLDSTAQEKGGFPEHVEMATASIDASGRVRIGNGLVRITVREDGRVHMHADNRIVSDLLGIEWVRDVGDLYTHQPEGSTDSGWSYHGATVLRGGALVSEVRLEYRMSVPCSRRSKQTVTQRLHVHLKLHAASPLVHVRVRGVNRARDHRTRLRISLEAEGTEVLADAALGPVLRSREAPHDAGRDPGPARRPGNPPHEAGVASKVNSSSMEGVEDMDAGPSSSHLYEFAPATAPLHRYVTLLGANPASLISDGLAEYEATVEGDVFVTLVRAVGQLSRGNLPNRPGHAGWPAATPNAQCLGSFETNLALLLHAAGTDRNELAIEAERAAEDVLVPLTGTTWRWLASTPPAVTGFELEGKGLAPRALMPHANGVILRCVNLTTDHATGAWVLPRDCAFTGAHLSRLDGTPLAALAIESGRVRFDAPPHATVTVLLSLDRPPASHAPRHPAELRPVP